MIVERRARRLAAWSGGGARGARERCATLTQAAALLALDRPAHAHLALGPAARLSPAHAADVLARRYHIVTTCNKGYRLCIILDSNLYGITAGAKRTTSVSRESEILYLCNLKNSLWSFINLLLQSGL